MIRNENEYQKAVNRINEENKRFEETISRLKKEGLNKKEITRVMEPIESFHLQLKEEVESYERLKRGEFQEMVNLRGFGHLLVCLRIAKGLSQAELAQKLGVSSSQISRDERNEYHGITLDRANKILEVLGVQIFSKIEIANNVAA